MVFRKQFGFGSFVSTLLLTLAIVVFLECIGISVMDLARDFRQSTINTLRNLHILPSSEEDLENDRAFFRSPDELREVYRSNRSKKDNLHPASSSDSMGGLSLLVVDKQKPLLNVVSDMMQIYEDLAKPAETGALPARDILEYIRDETGLSSKEFQHIQQQMEDSRPFIDMVIQSFGLKTYFPLIWDRIQGRVEPTELEAAWRHRMPEMERDVTSLVEAARMVEETIASRGGATLMTDGGIRAGLSLIEKAVEISMPNSATLSAHLRRSRSVAGQASGSLMSRIGVLQENRSKSIAAQDLISRRRSPLVPDSGGVLGTEAERMQAAPADTGLDSIDAGELFRARWKSRSHAINLWRDIIGRQSDPQALVSTLNVMDSLMEKIERNMDEIVEMSPSEVKKQLLEYRARIEKGEVEEAALDALVSRFPSLQASRERVVRETRNSENLLSPRLKTVNSSPQDAMSLIMDEYKKDMDFGRGIRTFLSDQALEESIRNEGIDLSTQREEFSITSVQMDLLRFEAVDKLQEQADRGEVISAEVTSYLSAQSSSASIDPFSGTTYQQRDFRYSIGPDNVDDKGTVCYDPTNGTRSRGDVFLKR